MQNNQAAIALSLSLSGGQGKTLTTYMIGLKVSKLGIPTLLIDGDPQRNLTDLLGVEVQNQPTLLEVITGKCSVEDAIYPVPDRDNLFLIPSDRALVNAQHYLASSANCSRVLKKRLQPVMNDFGLIVIDSPPQKNHINLTAIGAADVVIIPAEAVAKGIGSLTETWALLEECREGDAFDGQIISVLPFRARVVGVQLTGEASESLSAMRSFSGDVVLPAVVESVVYQRAINYGKLPSEVNAAKAELEQPFDVLLQRLSPYVSGMEVAIAEVVPA